MTDEDYRDPDLMEWWNTGQGRNANTILETKSGSMKVYVRRNAADTSVMEIAAVSTLHGFGASRVLYGSLTRDIPAIAENILNPQLDTYLFTRVGIGPTETLEIFQPV